MLQRFDGFAAEEITPDRFRIADRLSDRPAARECRGETARESVFSSPHVIDRHQ